MDDITSLKQSISDLKAQIETLQQLSPHEPTLLEKVNEKLSEQGTWRGILMILMGFLPQLQRIGINTDIVVNIFTGIASIYGVQNIATKG